MRMVLAAEASTFDPSYDGFDVQERIVVWGSGPHKLPRYTGHDYYVLGRRGLPEPPQEMVPVTYLDTVLVSRFAGALDGRLRPEHRRLMAAAMARGADASRRVDIDHEFSADDYHYIPENPAEEPAQLTDEAADRVRRAWVEACLAELLAVLIALRPNSRTPLVALELMQEILRFLLATAAPIRDPKASSPVQDEPPPMGEPEDSVTTLTAPHGPDKCGDAEPVHLVRAFVLAA